jgi:hypothetical protein
LADSPYAAALFLGCRADDRFTLFHNFYAVPIGRKARASPCPKSHERDAPDRSMSDECVEDGLDGERMLSARR